MSISSTPRRKSNIERAGRRHLPRGQAALARHEAEIERADARGRAVQHAIAVPAVLDRAEIDRGLAASEATAAPSRAQGPGADETSGRSALRSVGKAVPRDVGQRLRPGAEIVVGVGQRRLGPDQPIGTLGRRQRLRMRALSTAASRRGLVPTMRSASAVIDAGDGGVEQ